MYSCCDTITPQVGVAVTRAGIYTCIPDLYRVGQLCVVL